MVFIHSNVSLYYTHGPVVYISILLKSFLTPPSSIPPPSGSTASIHRTTAIVCFISFALIQILPFMPTAASSGKREPRKGSKKCFGSSKLQTSSGSHIGSGEIRTVDSCASYTGQQIHH